ncbi:MAG: radical SAM protein [Verrucomicrobia bacterium]|nr:radical SAM protein [Verrucomicrobiota bacterium]
MANDGYIQVTRRCNQQCRFCSNPENDHLLTLDEACTMVEALKNRGVSTISLSGGEPTLFDDLERLIAFCVQNGLQPKLITNGQRIADGAYLRSLVDAGLRSIHISIQSCRRSVHDWLVQNEGSFDNIVSALQKCREMNAQVRVNTVINRYNADHLHRTVEWFLRDFPEVHHFVWNNLDPHLNRVQAHPDVIPRLQGFEISLLKAARLLYETGRTFRIERVPLCYMVEFAEFSTETRKIVKQECRTVHFLDRRGATHQENFYHEKPRACHSCSLNSICAGVYCGDRYFSFDEIYPVFVDKESVVSRIHGRH